MAIVTTDSRYYSGIADAIRQKLGVSTQYRPDEMASAIESIGTTTGFAVTFTGNPIVATDTLADHPLIDLKIYGNSTQNGSPSLESPVPIVSAGESSNIAIVVTGKNLLNILDLKLDGKTNSGVTTHVNEDQTINLSGNATFNYLINAVYTILLSNGTSYKCFHTGSQFLKNDYVIRSYKNIEDAKSGSNFIEQKFLDDTSVFTVPNDGRVYATFQIRITGRSSSLNGKPVNENNIRLGFYVYAGSDEEYEPYEDQSVSIPRSSGLLGVQVESKGNYTAPDGRQYTSDYWDFGTGLQNICCGRIDSYNGEPITTPYISSTGALTNGAQVIYVLPEPQTQNIPEGILESYHGLTTYADTTVLSVYENIAGMEARVYCDVEKTIDRKVNEGVATALKLSGGNL